MHAFFAMLWNQADPRAAAAATRLAVQVRAALGESVHRLVGQGFALYALDAFQGGETLLALNDNEGRAVGAVFGTLFDTSASLSGSRAVLTRLGEVDTKRLLASQCRSIVKDYWGSYVAFLNCGNDTFVIADPTSSIPCFYTQQQGLTLVFSHLEKCPFLDMGAFTINERFISRVLAYDKIQHGETGLNEVRELLGGERLRISGAAPTTDLIWDPRQIALDVHAPSLKDAAAELRETTQAVVGTWGESFEKITVNLSGGLDSSIVLACLAKTTDPAKVNAVHFVMGAADATERRYARIIAEHTGHTLIEVLEEPTRPLPGVHEHPPTARPYRQFLGQELASRLAANTDVGRALFTGQGGDHLFLHSRSTLGFADYLAHHPLGLDAPAELLRSARLSQTSIWHVLRDTLPYRFGKTHRSAVVQDIEKRRTGVNQRAFDTLVAEDCMPVWTRQARGVPPAKFDQISYLVHLYQVRESLDHYGPKEMIHPLISQPLIELSLRLPTYLLCANGRSRGLARTAFTGMLSEQIRLRTSKGESTKFFAEHIKANSQQLLQALAEGELAARGMISRQEVQAFVARNDYKVQKFGFMMLPYYAIEAWLQTWKRISNGSSKAA
ncbi:asparagine synthase C-terminal domain-containing protein [Xanthomonas campestris pv. phormiicola]|nr:asparagine synthase C-terminal domain-containing protein [Xanthomonas campestris pv. phormiicola]UYC17397.1 asparagine synthase C-terminal domain-containing protein [Xanthomonas campestris pv. phormiicola]